MLAIVAVFIPILIATKGHECEEAIVVGPEFDELLLVVGDISTAPIRIDSPDNPNCDGVALYDIEVSEETPPQTDWPPITILDGEISVGPAEEAHARSIELRLKGCLKDDPEVCITTTGMLTIAV